MIYIYTHIYTYIYIHIYIHIYIYIYIYSLFRAAPMAYGGSQAMGRIGTIAAGHSHSHSIAGSIPQVRAMPDP